MISQGADQTPMADLHILGVGGVGRIEGETTPDGLCKLFKTAAHDNVGSPLIHGRPEGLLSL